MIREMDKKVVKQLKIADIFTGLFTALSRENINNLDGFLEEAAQKIIMVKKTLSMLDSNFSELFEDLLKAIQSKVCELTSSDRASIFIIDKNRTQLRLMVEGENNTSVEIRIPYDTSTIAGEVAVSKKTINIPYDFLMIPDQVLQKDILNQPGIALIPCLQFPCWTKKGISSPLLN